MERPEFYKPNPLLSDFISHIMIMEVKSGNAGAVFNPFPPTPQHAIHFYPRDPVQTRINENLVLTSPDSIIVGPQVHKVDIAFGNHHIIVSVAFHPGGLYRLLKMPMSELFDLPGFDTQMVLGKDIRHVNEQLKEAKTHLQMKTIVEQYFIKKIDSSRLMPWEQAMKEQLTQNGILRIKTLASLSCLGLRQFERKTNLLMGYSPKTFSKLIRFSKAYRLKELYPWLSWTQITHESGYFDQMHLIKDFKRFTGTSPTALTEQIHGAAFHLQKDLKI
jgi:AraC-like DNA-binding protein